jgi:predicted DNA-binding transcriptional regulator YafY
MPRNQEVIRQWKVLHALETARHGVAIDALADELGVTSRTIRRDLAALAGQMRRVRRMEHARGGNRRGLPPREEREQALPEPTALTRRQQSFGGARRSSRVSGIFPSKTLTQGAPA